MLINSNILIYATHAKYHELRSWLVETATSYEIAIELRQRKNVSLGDALIAATCIENKLTS